MIAFVHGMTVDMTETRWLLRPGGLVMRYI